MNPMKEPAPRPTLEEFRACCDASFSFLIGEYGFERLAAPTEYNDFSVRFRKGELEVVVIGENWGESASCELLRGKDELYYGFLVPASARETKRRRQPLGQLEQIRAMAGFVQRHVTDFLRGDLARFELALAEWRRVTQPRPISDAHRHEREKAQAVTAAGHASRHGDHATVVRHLEPFAGELSAHQRRMLDTARERLKEGSG